MNLLFWKHKPADEPRYSLPTTTITVDEWRKTPKLIDEAKKVVHSPEFKLMAAAVRATAFNEVLASRNAPQIARLKAFDNMAGIYAALAALESLAEPKSEQPAIEATYAPENWPDFKPDAP
jgi:hypothetical protein